MSQEIWELQDLEVLNLITRDLKKLVEGLRMDIQSTLTIIISESDVKEAAIQVQISKQ